MLFWAIFGHFEAFLAVFGSFQGILGHFGSFWYVFGRFWVILGHFWPFWDDQNLVSQIYSIKNYSGPIQFNKKNAFLCFFGPFLVISRRFWFISGHFGSFWYVCGCFWVILGHFWPFWDNQNLGKLPPTKTDEFLEKFQTGGGSFPIQKFLLQILDFWTGFFWHKNDTKGVFSGYVFFSIREGVKTPSHGKCP